MSSELQARKKRERWDGTYTHALEIATSTATARERRHGWEVGVIIHPASVNQIVMGAVHRGGGGRYAFILNRVDIIRPYTDGEVRAMILHQWGQQDPSLPEFIRLIAAQLVVERWRS